MNRLLFSGVPTLQAGLQNQRQQEDTVTMLPMPVTPQIHAAAATAATDPWLNSGLLQERGQALHACLASEASYNEFLDLLNYVHRVPPAQPPALDRVVSFCIAEVLIWPSASCKCQRQAVYGRPQYLLVTRAWHID